MKKLITTTALLFLVGAVAFSMQATQTTEAATPIRTADFIATQGVNLHVSQGSSNYAKMPMVITDMSYLGIVNIRDSLNSFWANPPYSYYTALARAGLKWNYISAVGGVRSPETIATFLTNVSKVETAVPGSTLAVEGPNEINNFALTWQPTGAKGLPAALAYQAELYRQTKALPLLKDAKVFYFTGYNAGGIPKGPDPATTPGLADFNNQHPYPSAARPPFNWVKRSAALGNASGGSGPAVYTETGYQQPKTSTAQSASWMLNIYANSALNNIYRTYVYQLMDEGDGYGLFTKADNQPTPTATAIRNLNQILLDTGPTATTFTPGTVVQYSYGTLPATGKLLVLQKSNSETNIMIWAEPDVFPGPSVPVKLNLGDVQTEVNVYDPLLGAQPIQSLRNVNSVQVNITDHPIIIQIPPSAVTAKAASKAAAKAAAAAAAKQAQ